MSDSTAAAVDKITNAMLFKPIPDGPGAGLTGFAALQAMKAVPLDGEVSFAIKQLVKSAKAAGEVYDEERIAIVRRFCAMKKVLGPSGEVDETDIGPDGQAIFLGETDDEKKANKDAFESALNTLFDQPTEIPLRTFPPSVFKGKPVAGVMFDALDWFIVDPPPAK
ncbi:MAG: hypothetical protein ISS15_05300 [Alphaproteobacteria bacterium]|nr:hypothetical protein [Alphaproteobacteria bacterium]MBL6939464.1 hypothetical protein [Alphaproteobacteria bacterium]MBL7097055.1 hypothetical protein [Alphaproteobacteria bacterium]